MAYVGLLRRNTFAARVTTFAANLYLDVEPYDFHCDPFVRMMLSRSTLPSELCDNAGTYPFITYLERWHASGRTVVLLLCSLLYQKMRLSAVHRQKINNLPGLS